MPNHSAEIETIVRVVLERLRSFSSASLAERVGGERKSDAPSDSLRIAGRLLTLSDLQGRLQGVRRVQVDMRAVVTPSVVDELRERGIGLERFDPESQNDNSQGTTGCRPLVVASAKHQSQLAPLVAALGTTFVTATTLEEETIEHIAELASDPQARVIWYAARPYAAALAAGSQRQLRTVQLPAGDELSRAVEQAQPTLLIIDSARWTPVAVGNLVRSWAKELP